MQIMPETGRFIAQRMGITYHDDDLYVSKKIFAWAAGIWLRWIWNSGILCLC